MNKLFSLVLLAVLSFGLTSCSSNDVKESMSEVVANTASYVVSSQLECSNLELVKLDIKVMTDKLFKVRTESKEKGSNVVSSASSASTVKGIDTKVMICKSVTGVLMPTVFSLMKAGKLSAWDCKVDKGEAALMKLIYSGCDKLAK